MKRFAPVVFPVLSRYRLAPSDAGDVRQALWLRLVEHITDLREPRALPGWITTTTKNEALRMLSDRLRVHLIDPQVDSALHQSSIVELDESLLRTERAAAVHAGLAELRPEHRDLMLLLLAEPMISYQEISRELGITTGSIGPLGPGA